MREEFFAQLHNRSTLVGMEVDLNKEEYTTEEIRLIHLAHCYDYLRQVILCHMDMTIEYPTGNGVAKGTISGYEVPHQCVKRVSTLFQPHVEKKRRDRRMLKYVLGTSRCIHGNACP
jgi:hypothetical protein